MLLVKIGDYIILCVCHRPYELWSLVIIGVAFFIDCKPTLFGHSIPPSVIYSPQMRTRRPRTALGLQPPRLSPSWKRGRTRALSRDANGPDSSTIGLQNAGAGGGFDGLSPSGFAAGVAGFFFRCFVEACGRNTTQDRDRHGLSPLSVGVSWARFLLRGVPLYGDPELEKTKTKHFHSV